MILVAALAALGACSRTTGGVTTVSAPASSSPAQTTAAALNATDLSEFLDGSVLARLSDKERAEAASAQFYALQFGRPAAPRQWQGDSGNSGKVTVGPYVRVNQRDCREFVHEISTGSGLSRSSGTACREPDGEWSVAQRS